MPAILPSRASARPLSLLLALTLCPLLPCAGAAQRAGGASPGEAPPAFARDAGIAAAVQAISLERLHADLAQLVSFGTRHTLSDTVSPTRGIGAARRWVYATLEGYSKACGGCLEVRYDPHDVVIQRWAEKPHARVVNVVATLRGRTDPRRLVVVTGHYDSCICSVNQQDSTSEAPGADDDGSGTAAVLELARVFSERFPQGLDGTIVFAAVAAEEQGLYGSQGLAQELTSDSTLDIEADITNDIVGSVRGQKGGIDSTAVRVFGGLPDDGPSQQLARYAVQAAHAYVPRFGVSFIERLDRIGRGGDHEPFWRAGVAAVRFSETLEDYLHQHRPEDRIEFVNFPYLRHVAQVNAATIGSLAAAPRAPVGLKLTRLIPSGGVDWDLTWTPVAHAPDLAGYEITIRRTTEPFVSRVVPVGNVSTYTLRDTQADDLWIGIRSVDREGHRSLIRSFMPPQPLPAALMPRPRGG